MDNIGLKRFEISNELENVDDVAQYITAMSELINEGPADNDANKMSMISVLHDCIDAVSKWDS